MTTCSVVGCDRERYARQQVCEAHYRRFRRVGSYGDVPIGARPPPRPCAADGCARAATERGFCHGHYLRLVRDGAISEQRPLQRRRNDVCIVRGCGRAADLRRMCRTHANRKRKYGDVQADKPIRAVAGCGFESHGYWHVPVPPDLRHLTGGLTPYPEHRLVMAQHLGRPLTPDESVHHRDGNRLNNELGNLELWSRWQPSGQRVCDKVDYAIAILERYLPDALSPQLPLLLEQETDLLSRKNR